MSRSFLPSVVVALESAGHVVVQRGVADNGRGDPAEWRISAPLDRAWVESRFDLGSLAWWYVGPAGGWVLVDALTQGTLHGSGEPVAFDPAGVVRRAGRTPLAHVEAVPELRRRWPVPSRSAQLAVLDGTALPVRGPHSTRSVQLDTSPAMVRDRVREVLTTVVRDLTDGTRATEVAAALPGWFVSACAPQARTTQEWVAWAQDAYADPASIRLRRWEARWSVDAWLRTMLPAERTWWLAELEAVSDGLHLTCLTAASGAPTSSLRWLLHVAGATACQPVVPPPAGQLVLPVLPPDDWRDPDDVLAALAHEIVGLPDPLVLDAVPRRGGYRWETRVETPLDTTLLDRQAPADRGLTWGGDATATWLTNGQSSVRGPSRTAPGPTPEPRRAWWRR